MASLRLHKINELFKREIGQIIQRDLGNPNIGFATVTHVAISPDLKHAAVRVSIMGDDQKRRVAIDELNKAAGFVQHVLGQRISIRTMPRLSFKLDRSLDAVSRVEELLDQVHAENGQSGHLGDDAPDETNNEAVPGHEDTDE